MEKNLNGFGGRLVKAGLINEEQLADALLWQKQEDTLLGETLVNHGIITREQLFRFIFTSPGATLGEVLIGNGYIDREQLAEALRYQQQYGGRLGTICVSLGFLTPQQLESTLAQRVAPKGRLGDELLRLGIITQEQLDTALETQKRSGGRLGEILLFLEYVTEEQLYRVLATQGEIGRLGSNVRLADVRALPYKMANRYAAIIIREEKQYTVVAVEAKLGEDAVKDIEAYLGKPIEQVLMTNAERLQFWEQAYRREEILGSVFALYDEQPQNSAIETFTTTQLVVLLALFAVFLLALTANWFTTLLTLVIVFQIAYLSMAIAKFWIVIKGARHNAQLRFSAEEVAAVHEAELPVYTLLIPVYKEKEVLPDLLKRIQNLDYPKYKLDVRILLEENDPETIAVVHAMRLPSYFTPIIVPASKPQTKPKACNYGLLQAKGEYVVIYDAEDRPEPDQLKKAYLAFQQLPEEYVCIQAKLNYFNSRQNLLTRLFTQEYSMWFELLLVGIMQMDIPIPLGGTSNHFKMSFLKRVGGWDPFNVTEDADLGIRLYKYRYKTAILDSRTWEEANSDIGNWIRQRSRWIKGYMQTFFVHMRQPVKFYRQIGFRGMLGYLAMILGTPLLPLLNPIFWGMMVVWLILQPAWVQMFFPGPIYYISVIQLIIGNFIFIYMNIVGTYYVIRDCAIKKDQPFSYGLIRSGLLTPLYWVLMSVAAYKALFQLIVKPHYWEKTLHGLTEQSNVDQMQFIEHLVTVEQIEGRNDENKSSNSIRK
ncbi:glycosyltransferase family 2 protein [Faecalispora anaeroviscerum]|uniref:glycosyltransferase family 2 protein n=1 Tax=Faecalispora anaeroviscerum TaxID=2991836 RepID=UPI0024BB00EF|nr:glycosyltransferase family 2 protein [Faecalispora anaeroviscerum]